MKSIIVINVTFINECDTCQQFNDFFSTIDKKVQETIPDTSSNDDFSKYLFDSQCTDSFKFS